MKLTKLLYFSIVCLSSSLYLYPLVDLSKTDLSTNKIRILVGEDNTARQKLLEDLKSELTTLETKWKESSDILQKKTQDTKQAIDGLKREAGHHPRFAEQVSKKITLYNKLLQVLLDVKETKKQIIEIVKQHIDYWEKYFASGGKIIERIEEKSLYTFSDLQAITKKIALEEEQRYRWIAKKEEEDGAIHRQEHQVSVKERDIRNVEKEIEDLKKQSEDVDIKSKVDVLDAEKEVAHKERELAEVRVEKHQKDAQLYESRIMVTQERIKALREDMTTIRNRIHIDKTEVSQYEQKRNQVKREVTIKKTKLTDKKNTVLAEKNAAQEKLNVYSNRFNIALSNIRQIEDWEIEFDTIPNAYAAYLVSHEQTKVALAEKLLEKIAAEIAIEDARLEQAQVLYETARSWYNLTQGLYRDGDYLDKERLSFKEQKHTILADIKKDKKEITAAHSFIKDQFKIVSNLKKQQEKLKSFGSKIAPANQKKYEESVQLLASASQKIELQKDVALNLSELYTKLTDLKEETLENVSFMLQELETVGVWHRATSAVTWEGIKNIVPNMQLFVQGVAATIVSYIKHFDLHEIAYNLSTITFSQIFFFILFLFLSFILFAFLQAFLPTVYRTLMTTEVDQRSMYGLNRFLVVWVSFLISIFNQLYWWFIFLLFSLWYTLPVAIMLIFLTYSIMFWVYASRVFLHQFLIINRRSDYVLLNKRLVDRFAFIFSFFSVSTILILFIRRMFMLVMTYQQSEFPNILLRVYHVVIFISIVFSIDKEELLYLLPAKSRFGQTIASLIQQYYYVFLAMLLGLLVMGDPYLGGYGTLIWYIFWNTVFTMFTLVTLFFIHKFVRQYTEILFFQEDELSGSSVERFENAKTWYGFYVVVLFLSFLLLATMICANIWGYGFTLHTLKEALYYELPYKFEYAGSVVSLKVIDLVRICIIVVLGFLSAYLFRRFVLDKIFEIHYVDPGVQNTITIISRYVIIFISFMVAFAQAGLGNFVTYTLFIGLLTFGWSFKDLFTDVVAYFFILVQRPLKLGDFVKLDSHTMGVVRKISPRAVILRRKNAVNIVVPNSTVLKASLYNWNYTRTYIGFSDIFFAVDFDTDITIVKEVLLKILDEDPDVLKVPQPIVRLDDFSDKGYVFMIRGFLSSGNTLRQWDITSNIRFAIVAELKKKGIQVAAPSVDVVIHKKSIKDIYNHSNDVLDQ
ncbi:MAG: hypothetical protein CL947_01795 [Epsilonproteobacteria bacterium]|nr:hypothetical protein [Campylobacterota bacterium]|tara:strand:- start:214 stop:3807 length:3594 start_codon:yes stop_codon:yes gene_type:complete